MPIYEYKCDNCETKYDMFHKSTVRHEDIMCPKCGSDKQRKLFSAFATSNSSSDFTSTCTSGNCNTDYSNSCASGMCGLN